MTLTIPVAIGLALWIAGNAIAIIRCVQTNSLPDPTLLLVDAGVSLYVLTAAGVH